MLVLEVAVEPVHHGALEHPVGPVARRGTTPWPPQNQIIFTGTPLRFRIAWLRIASLSVNSVSAVPWRSSVGHADPRDQRSGAAGAEEGDGLLGEAARRRALDQRLVDLRVEAPVCGPAGLITPPVTDGWPAPPSSRAPALLDRALLVEAVSSEFQAIVGVIASTRRSMPAVTSWMPPP